MDEITVRNYWHPLAKSDEIISKPKQFKILGELIVAYKDIEGVVAFKDLCIHRGAALSGGSVNEGSITCPYHGWTFNRNGTCTKIPSLPDKEKIPSTWKINKFKTKEAYDLVWIVLDKPYQNFPIWIDEAWNREDFKTFLVDTYEWKASAGRIVENVLDFSHFNFVHKGFTELADGPQIKPFNIKKNGDGFEFSYDDTKLLREYYLTFPFILHDRKRVINEKKESSTWSSNSDSKAGDITILSFIASPIDKDNTRIYVFIGRNHSLNKSNESMSEGFDEIMEQDRVIVENQRPELIPLNIREEVHVKFPDSTSVQYRKIWRDLLQNQSDTDDHSKYVDNI